MQTELDVLNKNLDLMEDTNKDEVSKMHEQESDIKETITFPLSSKLHNTDPHPLGSTLVLQYFCECLLAGG